MPELPEVETIRQDLRKKILGIKISNVFVIDKKTVKSKADSFINSLKKNQFIDIDRIGKLLIFVLSKKEKRYLLTHLKMTGQLVYKEKAPLRRGGLRGVLPGGHYSSDFDKLPNKHTRAYIEFKNGSHLYFNDMRRFGYLEIVGNERLKEIKEKYGIEPLQKNFKIDDFKKLFKKRKAPVKAVLLNQNLIAGIGNIYADEILFKAGVRPDRKADSLKPEELKKIYKATEEIIAKAIKFRGTTFSDYRDAYGKRGNFVKFLRMYGRKEGQKCFRCSGKIKKARVAGRGTRYCPACQF